MPDVVWLILTLLGCTVGILFALGRIAHALEQMNDDEYDDVRDDGEAGHSSR